jgi:hypothetical protein
VSDLELNNIGGVNVFVSMLMFNKIYYFIFITLVTNVCRTNSKTGLLRVRNKNELVWLLV